MTLPGFEVVITKEGRTHYCRVRILKEKTDVRAVSFLGSQACCLRALSLACVYLNKDILTPIHYCCLNPLVSDNLV